MLFLVTGMYTAASWRAASRATSSLLVTLLFCRHSARLFSGSPSTALLSASRTLSGPNPAGPFGLILEFFFPEREVRFHFVGLQVMWQQGQVPLPRNIWKPACFSASPSASSTFNCIRLYCEATSWRWCKIIGKVSFSSFFY